MCLSLTLFAGPAFSFRFYVLFGGPRLSYQDDHRRASVFCVPDAEALCGCSNGECHFSDVLGTVGCPDLNDDY